MREITPGDVEVASIRESAQRLGIELDEADALRWLAAMAAPDAPDDVDDPGADIVVDEEAGVFGHKVSMLDFSPRDLARFRRIGEIVKVTGPEGVEAALALSGSAAQSKIQTHPGDADFFQRLNIQAPTRAEASRTLARLMRDKAIAFASGETYQFVEAKWSEYPFDCVKDGRSRRRGSAISWSLAEITAGGMQVERDGEPVLLDWFELADNPGWCKLDWVVVDPASQRLTNASNVIDVTWEAPDGEIVPLDGYLDAYFQEVYLDADAVPVFSKVVQHVSGNALDEYVAQLEGEVRKYLTDHENYGKAAKRMYNVFRLTGRYLDAAFVRELFDEPTTFLYQVWSLIGTLDNATRPGSTIPMEAVRAQADDLVIKVVQALDGVEEAEIVTALLRLRNALEPDQPGEDRGSEVEAAKGQVINLINSFFRDRLVGVPTIKAYIDQMRQLPTA